MKVWMKLFLLALTHIQCKASNAATKTWLPNTNFNNAMNWNLKRLPCPRDRVVFPAGAGVSVYLQTNSTIRELVLPSNGELLFPPDGVVVFIDETSGLDNSCSGEDIQFSATDVKLWYDPANWLHAQVVGTPSPVPHSDRIPCTHDSVIFPEGSTFNIEVSGPDVTVGTLHINGKSLTTQALQNFLSTDVGKSQFHVKTSMSVLGTGCTDVTGCVCGNDRPTVMQHICELQRVNCVPALCNNPIRPAGHCCDMCGSYILMEVNEKIFKWDDLQNLLQQYLKKNQYSTVRGYLGKTSAGKLQAVFVDTLKDTAKGTHLVRDMADYLQKDMAHLDMYGVTKVTMFDSGTAIPFAPHTSEVSNTSSILGIVFGVLVVIMLPLILLLVYRRGSFRSNLPFMFARFENESQGLEMEGCPARVEIVNPSLGLPQARLYSKAFDNPMFDTELPTELPPFSYGESGLGSSSTVSTSAAHLSEDTTGGDPLQSATESEEEE